MKRILLLLAGIAFMASCSAPKYSYNFDHYNYNAGKKKSSPVAEAVAIGGPEKIQPELLTASANNEVISVQPNTSIVTETVASKKVYAEMTRAEKKEVKKEIKKVIKAEKKSIKATQAAKGMDHDLKLAAIFGAVGIVALIISGNVFYIIGGIALIIGVVFFVKWLINQ